MKPLKVLLPIFILAFFSSKAQTETPKGFVTGKIYLSDSTIVSGFFKEKIRSNASLQYLGQDNKKKIYDGSDLLGAEIGEVKYLCTRGDFFRIITDGEIKFLQKASDASYKPIYNGSQAVFANGTDGRPGDYFIYIKSKKQLTLVTKKTASEAAQWFAGCEEAIAKAKTASENISQFGEAVVIYNNRNRN
jgi:hypothetical protein